METGIEKSRFFENKINVGTILQIIVLVAGIIFMYSQLIAHQKYLEVQLADQQQQLALIRSQYKRNDLYRIENQIVENRLDDIRNRLSRIEEYLNKRIYR